MSLSPWPTFLVLSNRSSYIAFFLCRLVIFQSSNLIFLCHSPLDPIQSPVTKIVEEEATPRGRKNEASPSSRSTDIEEKFQSTDSRWPLLNRWSHPSTPTTNSQAKTLLTASISGVPPSTEISTVVE